LPHTKSSARRLQGHSPIKNGGDTADCTTYVFYISCHISSCTESILTCDFILESSNKMLLALLDNIHYYSRWRRQLNESINL
jgi:hypothetical protein